MLGFAIASVLKQSEQDFELLVVLDGCDDDTRDVVSAFSDARIRVFDLPKGPGFGYANRNTALRTARGHFMAFCAHDDLLLDDHLQRLSALLVESGATLAYSRPLWVSTDGIIVPFGTNLTLDDEMRRFTTQENTIYASAVLTTRAAVTAARYWPEDAANSADWLLWRNILGAGGSRVAYDRVPTTLHFSADWKKSRFSATREVARLLAIADGAAWWPRDLVHPVGGGRPEQAAVFHALDANGPAFQARLRRAVDCVCDRLAWDVACGIAPGHTGANPLLAAAWRDLVPGALRGALDVVVAASGSERSYVAGWVLDENHPDLPVMFEIWLDGIRIGTSVADRFRPDLLVAQLGHGRCAFRAALPPNLGDADLLRLELRRTQDGALLPGAVPPRSGGSAAG